MDPSQPVLVFDNGAHSIKTAYTTPLDPYASLHPSAWVVFPSRLNFSLPGLVRSTDNSDLRIVGVEYQLIGMRSWEARPKRGVTLQTSGINVEISVDWRSGYPWIKWVHDSSLHDGQVERDGSACSNQPDSSWFRRCWTKWQNWCKIFVWFDLVLLRVYWTIGKLRNKSGIEFSAGKVEV